MTTVGRAVVAVAVAAGAAGLLVADPFGLVEALSALGGAETGQPATVPELADRTAEREHRVATLQAVLALDPILSASLLAVGGGAGLVAGGSITYLRERRAIRRGKEDA